MTYKLLSPAEEELYRGAAFLQSRRPGFGLKFLSEFERVMARIMENPDAWKRVSSNLRRCNFHGFPYGVLYAKENDRIEVVAVMHLHREPDYWLDRIDG